MIPPVTLPATFSNPREFYSLDVETWLIQAGILAPPLVCGSAAMLAADGSIASEPLGKRERDDDTFADVLDEFIRALDNPSITIVGCNIAFDMLVLAVFAGTRGIDLLPRIFAKYAAGRVYDVQIAEQLHAVGRGHLGFDPRNGRPVADPITGKPGRYSLAICCDLVLDFVNAKVHDEYRKSYDTLDATPMVAWPGTAVQYLRDDVVNALLVALAQCGHIESRSAHELYDGQCRRCGLGWTENLPRICQTRSIRFNMHDHSVQVFKAFALHLAAAWGLRTDGRRVEALAGVVEAARAIGRPQFIEAGFLRDKPKPDGSYSEHQAVVKLAVALAYGVTGTCERCRGARKVTSPKSGNPIVCTWCSGTGLDVNSAPAPRTDPSTKFEQGQIQTGRDILVETGDELLMAYGAYQEDDKIAETYVPFLRLGAEHPICLRPNPILETGRVSYSDPAQTFPRNVSPRLKILLDDLRKTNPHAPHGVRDCMVARPGWLFDSEDYKGGELITFSESCVKRVGSSRMGEALIRGLDVHTALGATMLGVSYEVFVEMLDGKHGPEKKTIAKAFRQAAKPANFGFPGGMGPVKLVLQQRKAGPDTPHPNGPSEVWDGKAWVRGYKGTRFCVLIGGAERCGEIKVTEWKRRPCPPTCRRCIEVAESQLRETWFRQWPEARPYLDWHAHNASEIGWVVQHFSGRIRGDTNFCSEANGDFQAWLADITGRAQILVSFEQYVPGVICDFGKYAGLPSPLYGSRSILFAHDELFGESPASISVDVATRKSEIMVDVARKACPVHAAAWEAQPTLMFKWFKQAEPLYQDADGKTHGDPGPGRVLIPWEPATKYAKA